MHGTRRRKKQKKNPLITIPGPVRCSPLAKTKRTGKKCITNDIYTKVITSLPKRGGYTRKQSVFKKNGCKKNDTRCLVEKSTLPYKVKKSILKSYFRPPMPEEWKKDPDAWLSSDDIAAVMKQYEQAYPDFRFVGVVPIDFSAPDPYIHSVKKCMNNQFCEINLKEERAKGRRILGAVFNLDPHYKEGSHWIALAIDLKRNEVCYFDSYGMEPPPQVARFMRYLTLQEPNLKLQRNARRMQYKESECGMFCLYFIIKMIEGIHFKKLCKHRIPDNHMLHIRNILFDPNTTIKESESQFAQ